MTAKIDIHDFCAGKRCVRAQQSGTATTQDFFVNLEQNTTATDADGAAVMTHLQKFLIECLSMGQTVTIDGIGTFSVAYRIKPSSRGKETAQLTAADVEMKRITFKAAPTLRQGIDARLTLRRVDKEQRQTNSARLDSDARRDVAVRLAEENGRFMAEDYAAAAHVSKGQAYRDLARFVADGVLKVSALHRYKMYSAV